jgi:hypothetical protein
VVEISAKAAMALHCSVSEVVKFDRKHYYYPVFAVHIWGIVFDLLNTGYSKELSDHPV